MKLDGKKILITGASTGIGYAISRELGKKGCYIAILARREDKLQALAEEIRKYGGQALAIPVDVMDADSVKQAITTANRDLDGLDVVIANAGVGILKPAHQIEPRHVDRMVDVNLKGAMYTLLAGLDILLQHGGGQLVGVSSIASYRGLPQSSVYSATKAALSSFLESLRVEYAKKNIRVTTICPGYIKTPMTEGAKMPMPMMLEADVAARMIIDAIEKEKKVYGFPWPMNFGVKLVRFLPNFIYDAVIKLVV